MFMWLTSCWWESVFKEHFSQLNEWIVICVSSALLLLNKDLQKLHSNWVASLWLKFMWFTSCWFDSVLKGHLSHFIMWVCMCVCSASLLSNVFLHTLQVYDCWTAFCSDRLPGLFLEWPWFLCLLRISKYSVIVSTSFTTLVGGLSSLTFLS